MITVSAPAHVRHRHEVALADLRLELHANMSVFGVGGTAWPDELEHKRPALAQHAHVHVLASGRVELGR
eukprot:1989383-Pleurochrysis_carterae.AAC.1